jgi:death-on-curing protein
MSEPLVHPTVQVVMAIHAEVLAAHGGAAGVRDQALLELAVAVRKRRWWGRP